MPCRLPRKSISWIHDAPVYLIWSNHEFALPLLHQHTLSVGEEEEAEIAHG